MAKPLQPIKVSELIRKLNLFLSEHGDRDVAISVLTVSDPPTSAAGSTHYLTNIAIDQGREEIIREGYMGDKPVCEIALHFFPKGHSSLRID